MRKTTYIAPKGISRTAGSSAVQTPSPVLKQSSAAERAPAAKKPRTGSELDTAETPKANSKAEEVRAVKSDGQKDVGRLDTAADDVLPSELPNADGRRKKSDVGALMREAELDEETRAANFKAALGLQRVPKDNGDQEIPQTIANSQTAIVPSLKKRMPRHIMTGSPPKARPPSMAGFPPMTESLPKTESPPKIGSPKTGSTLKTGSPPMTGFPPITGPPPLLGSPPLVGSSPKEKTRTPNPVRKSVRPLLPKTTGQEPKLWILHTRSKFFLRAFC